MSQSHLDPFYPIFDSYVWLQRVIPLGVKLVQLRIKDESDESVRQQIANSRALCEKYGCQLIVNDYWQQAIDLGCDYVHLGQEDLDEADMTSIRKAHIRVGISTHSDEELDRALSYSPDYVALGPVYPTILKKMPWAPQGLEKLGVWKKAVGDIPLIGIGGLSLERAPGVFDAGADVVSVVTDITLHEDPESQVTRWIDATACYR
ncbi:MAG: thiamine phosphate synthase [Granulosicoccus sp.]|nr:thiamine phosphate synthase [Granulosicoccus sp.]